MKRLIAATMAAVLAMAIVPALAFSSPQGHGKSAAGHGNTAQHRNTSTHGNGKSTKAGKSSSGMSGKGHKAAKHVAKAPKQHGKAMKPKHEFSGYLETSATPDATVTPGAETSGTTDASETAPAKLHGIANALWHLQANLARMQAQFDAGQRSHLPSGLMATIDKFMAWLHMTPGTTPGGETTGTVEPTSTVEPTMTVEPTGTVTPTETVDPSSPVTPTAPIL
jgi:hypothetical protein